MRYEIKGETLPVVICYLESGEKMITERDQCRGCHRIWRCRRHQTEVSEKYLEEHFQEKLYFKILTQHRAEME